MPIRVSDAVNDANTTNFVSVMNAQLGGSAVIEFFDGFLPTVCSDPDSGTMLADLALDATTPFAAASGNVFSANAITPDVVDVSGTATYWRMKSSGGTVHMQGDCGTTGTDIVFNTVTWTAADDISIDALDFTMQTVG